MKLFGEKVVNSFTNSSFNILQVQDFSEVFFDVYEIELNNGKFHVEKISEYMGNPVVAVPIIVEGQDIIYPFVLTKGDYNLVFHSKNTEIPIDASTPEIVTEELVEDRIQESKQVILEQIEAAKISAKKFAQRVKKQKILEANREISEKRKALSKTLETARTKLVDEFINISNSIKAELVEDNDSRFSEIKETIDNKIEYLAATLQESLANDLANSSERIDNSVKSLVDEMYESITPKIDDELKNITLDIVERVGAIENNLTNRLTDKVDVKDIKLMEEGLASAISANVELHDKISKGVHKALSRVGNIDKRVDELTIALSEEVNNRVNEAENHITSYYKEKIDLLETQTFNLNENTRKYFIDLITESRDNLISEIRVLKNEKPVEYIVESKGKKQTINSDDLVKDFDKKINTKIDNEVTRLRKYIAVYSGGGSVAMQFADGGTMNGSLTVVGAISASQYLGLPTSITGDDEAASTKVRSSSAYWDSTYTTVQANSASWASGGGSISGAYLPLSGGTLSGSLSVLGGAYIGGDTIIIGSISASQYLGLPIATGDDVSASTKVRSSSAYWDSTYTTVNNLSSGWNYQGLDLKALSGNWENTYTTVQANSASWGSGNYLSLSGGTVDGNLIITGSISASQYLGLPTSTEADTLSSVTSRGNTTTDSISVSGLYTPYIQFDIDASPMPSVEGLSQWNAIDQCRDTGMFGGLVTIQDGQELVLIAKNESGATIENGKCVYLDAAIDGRPTIRLANNKSSLMTRKTIGVATMDITHTSEGVVTTFGKVRGINTSSFVLGGVLYVDEVDGMLTQTKPIGDKWITNVGIVSKIGVLDGEILVRSIQYEKPDELNNITGFPKQNAPEFSISCTEILVGASDIARFTISPLSGSYVFYQQGTQYRKLSAESIDISDLEGVHYIYYNYGVLSEIYAPTQGQVDDLIRNKVLISQIYWNSVDKKHIILGREYHGCTMSGDTHAYLHFTEGAKWVSGMGLNTIDTTGNGSLSAHAQFGVDAGIGVDEDLVLYESPIGSTVGLPIFYLSGSSNLRRIYQPNFSVLTDTVAGVGSTGRLVYNKLTAGVWSLATLTSGNFVLCHVFGTNDFNQPYIAFVGQVDYSTAGAARTGAASEIGSVITAFPKSELIPIATLIYDSKTTYANAVKAKVVEVSTGVKYVDWRTSNIVASSTLTPSDHNSLTGKQGGTIGEYYHLTAAEATVVSNTSGTNTGDLSAASQAQMEAGVESSLLAMSPLRVSQAIAALGGFSGTTNRITVGGDTDSSLETTISTTGTNATVNSVNLKVPTAVGSTDVNFVLTPKGSGAFILGPVPDGTATGGNARGIGAVDLQTLRSSASQVASGERSVIAGGQRNTASATYSFVGGGYSNTTSGGTAVIGGGELNTASANYSSVIGGRSNTASGIESTVLGGAGNRAQAQWTVASGYNSKADRVGMFARATGMFSVTGDVQSFALTQREVTTSTTPKELITEGSDRLTVPSGKTFGFTANVIGVESTGKTVAHYIRKGVIRNLFRTVSSVDTTGNTIAFTINHNVLDDDPIRITSSSTMIAGITEGAIYYAKVINATTISVHTATPVGAGNIVDITSAGTGTRYMSSTKLVSSSTIGTDEAGGTSIAISCTPVASTADPALGDATKNSDKLTILVTGVAGETWRWGADVQAVEIAYGT